MTITRSLPIYWLSHIKFPIKKYDAPHYKYHQYIILLVHQATFEHLLHNHARAKVKVLPDDADNLTVGLITCPISVNIDGEGLGHSNGI